MKQITRGRQAASGGWPYQSLVLMAALALGALGAGALFAADAVSPEWEVGQADVSPRDLVVTAPPEAPAELTIQEAVDIALRHNVGFRRTLQRLLAARSSWLTARQLWDLEVFGSVTRTGDGEALDSREAGAALRYGATTGADLSLRAALRDLQDEESQAELQASLRQPLLAGAGPASSAYEQLRRARNSYRAALLSFFVERQSLVASVISSYFGALEQQQLVENQEFSLTLAQEAVRDSELRLQEGLIAELDLTRAQLSLSRAQSALIGQRRAMRDAMDRLLLLLGLQVDGDPALVTTVSYEPLEMDLEAAISQALLLQPDLQLADLGLENREAALRIARSYSLPSLDLVGAWRRSDNALAQDSWTAGLQLSVPIASRSLREAVLQAQWDLLVEQQAKEDLRQRIVSEVRSQFRAAEAARANVEIASQSLEVARSSLHFARRMVEEGLRTNRDLLDAQEDLTRTSNLLVSSNIAYYLALVRLRQAIGLDISQDLPTERREPQEVPPTP